MFCWLMVPEQAPSGKTHWQGSATHLGTSLRTEPLGDPRRFCFHLHTFLMFIDFLLSVSQALSAWTKCKMYYLTPKTQIWWAKSSHLSPCTHQIPLHVVQHASVICNGQFASLESSTKKHQILWAMGPNMTKPNQQALVIVNIQQKPFKSDKKL